MPNPSPSDTNLPERTPYQVGDVRRMMRGELLGAPYNPRRISPVAAQALKRNIREVGLLGPAIVWNETTGNVVSGHQRLAQLDALSESAEYSLDVTVVRLSEKREREQNVFMNNPAMMGEFDEEGMAAILTDQEVKVDWENMGLDRVEIENFLADSHPEVVSALFRPAAPDSAEAGLASEVERIAAHAKGEKLARAAAADPNVLKPPDEGALRRNKDFQLAKQAEARSYDPFFTLLFANHEQADAILAAFGVPPEARGQRHHDGRAIAAYLGIELPATSSDAD